MDSKKILQSFKVKDELNPEIWDYANSENKKEPHLKPEIDERLLEIAEKLNIHPSKYGKINEILRDEISDVNKTIESKKRTYSWLIFQAETEEQKDKVIISFLKTLFNYNYKK